MGLPSSGSSHHRRRSSVRAGAITGPTHTAINSPATEDSRDSHPHTYCPLESSNPNKHLVTDEQELLDDDDTDSVSDLTSSADDSFNMDYISSDDDLHDDEETGLTLKQRRQRRRRRQQRRQLDARIAGVKASRQDGGGGSRLADLSVAKRLFVNAILIGLWYFFSLAISIVSFTFSVFGGIVEILRSMLIDITLSITSGCFPTPKAPSSFLSLYSPLACIWLCSSLSPASYSLSFLPCVLEVRPPLHLPPPMIPPTKPQLWPSFFT